MRLLHPNSQGTPLRNSKGSGYFARFFSSNSRTKIHMSFVDLKHDAYEFRLL